MTDKSKLSEALKNAGKGALVVQSSGQKSGGGLGSALARRDGNLSPLTGKGPATASISAVHKAVAASTLSAQTAANDEQRARGHLKGISFVIDATGSREHSWREAQYMQAKMFDSVKSVGDLQVGIVCHRDDGIENLGVFGSADAAKRAMAAVTCKTGVTKVVGSLSTALRNSPSTIIMVGDCFEEDYGDLQAVCAQLKAQRIKVYAFVEGDDAKGNHAYKMAAELTNGVFQKFGAGLDLSDLCVAAAVLDIGGQQAFDKLLSSGHKGAKALQGQVMQRLSGPGQKLLK